jgi:predicted transcriptional regulator
MQQPKKISVLDKNTTIKRAIRKMIDEKAYACHVTDKGEIIAEIKVGDLLKATMEGYSSQTTLEKMLLGKIFEKFFTLE